MRGALPRAVDGGGPARAPCRPAMEIVRAPRGTDRSCKGWVQEAALRMLMNNLDPEVAERPQDLVVYGGTGKAARDWESYRRIVAALRDLSDEETLLVQSGKPVGVLGTHPDAPRVLIANSNLVPRWATWEHFWDLERRGLIMYGQMTAGSWIYIGTQGILQGTYETFAQAGRTHFGIGRPLGPARPLRRPRRHGRRPAARRDDARGRLPRSRDRPGPHPQADRDRLPRRGERIARRRPRQARRGAKGPATAVDRPPRQRRRRLPRAGAPPHRPRPRHRPDLGPRSTEWIRPRRRPARRPAGAPGSRPAGRHPPRQGVHGGAGDGHARDAEHGEPRLRLREQPARRCPGRRRRARLRLPGLRPRLHPPHVLRGPRALSLGGAVRRPRRHPAHRRGGGAALPGEEGASCAGSTSPGRRSGSRGSRPASAGSATASGTGPAWPSTTSSGRARYGPPSSSAATTSTAARSPRPTARPRR